MQLLHEAAARCVELIRDGSGAGVVSFDHDAYPGEPLAAFQAANTHRADVVTAVNGLTPGGATSIGDGVELARTTLNAGAASFDGHAIVVLTDGLENQPKSLDQVSGSIDSRTFAIGLGTAQQVSTAALTKIAQNTGGYILLTGPLTPNTDTYFLLSKYFQQILVTATAENIVTDPSGFVGPDAEVRVHFELSEADIDATVVLFVDVPAVRLWIETPSGKRLSEAKLAALGAQVAHGTNMTFCRFGLPLPVGTGEHRGIWHAVLRVDKARLKRAITGRPRERGAAASRVELQRLRAHGVRYNVTVSTWSNVRMSARLAQSSFEPGATLGLDVTLSEYGLPIDHRARVEADVTKPDGSALKVSLPETAPGSFQADLVTAQSGVWRVRVRARGYSYGGSAFTREQLLSAAVIVIDRPPMLPSGGDRSLECLIDCLIDDPAVKRWLRKSGINYERLIDCVERCRTIADPAALDRLG
jgi:hypothetical protein